MLPIPIASFSTPSSRELFPEEQSSRPCSRKFSVWDLLVFVTIVGLFVLYSTTNSTSAREGKGDDKPPSVRPPPPPPQQLFDTTSLSQLKQELTQYYHGKDVGLAFLSRDGGVAQLARKIAQRRRHGNQRFVLAYISNGELDGEAEEAEDFYLTLVNQTMFGLFQSVANVELEIRYIVLPNNSPTSILACLDTHLGKAVDLVHFSFPHAEFDVGALSNSFRTKLVHVVTAKLDSVQQSQLQALMPAGQVDWLSLDVGLKQVLNHAHHAWGEVGDGLHSHTRSAKPGVVWKNWVPGALGHQFLADATSMLLIQALELAAGDGGEAAMPSPSEQEVSSLCYSTHTPLYGSPSIALEDAGNWQRAVAASGKQQQEAYWEPGTQAGNLVFDIPQTPTAAKLYVCCCCSQVCAQEQLLTGADFSLQHSAVQLDNSPSNSRSDCLLVTANLTTPNRLTISPSSPFSSSRPLRIARVLVVATSKVDN